ncbi:hypothetical protein RB653_010324 [Dictyostelium firmibasis]|uniref:FNIP repeat-containing protein n=1 Tax=Dictyostelium firmibasis TaxID=79012 RepID=A0AAN7TLD5_9MYCE
MNYNDRLFFKIWRNKPIRTEIIYHLRISNNHISQRCFMFSDLLDGTLTSYPFKDYLKSFLIKDTIKDTTEEQIFVISKLLKNLPPSVDTIQLKLYSNSQPIFKTSFLPPSVTHLSIFHSHIPILNENNFDSNNLKSLQLESTQDIQFPTSNSTSTTNNNISSESLKCRKSTVEETLKGSMFLGLTSLDLSIKFNSEILPNVLPETLKTLKLSQDFNKPLYVGSLPQSLKYLKFGSNFNQPLIPIDVMPKKLEYLYFGVSFNQSIDFLPISNLETLEFSLYSNFNNKLKLSHSNKLKVLKIGSTYDYGGIVYENNIDDDKNNSNNVNKSITKLRVGKKLNLKKLKKFSNLLKLDISNVSSIETGFTSSSHTIPNTINTLTVNLENGHLESIVIPRSVEKLIITNSIFKTITNFNIIPNHITSLDFQTFHHQEFNPSRLFRKLGNLKSISFRKFYYPLSRIKNNHNLPNNLVMLMELNEDHNEEEETIFPKSVENIEFISLSTIIKPLVSFPENLKSLKIFDHKRVFPKLPDSITLLELPTLQGTQIIDSTWLPSSLEILILTGEPIINNINDLPMSLKSLYIGNNNKSILENFQLFSQLLPIIKVYDYRDSKLFKKQLK